jgi:uracil-DNA glycosylase
VFFKLPIRGWKAFFESKEIASQIHGIETVIKDAYQQQSCMPHVDRIFRAFECCDVSSVKVIILGQDPYPAPGVADGLAFSTAKRGHIPASLKNILKESGNDGVTDGDLTYWANQGVLLLNTVLSVECGSPNSHKGIGWELLTQKVLSFLVDRGRPMVLMLWGSQAQKLGAPFMDKSHLQILKSGHPSPLSANRGLWFGNDHFNKANQFLAKNHLDPIDWKLPANTFYSEPTLF